MWKFINQYNNDGDKLLVTTNNNIGRGVWIYQE